MDRDNGRLSSTCLLGFQHPACGTRRPAPDLPLRSLVAADLVTTSQQKFPVGSPANVKVCKVPAQQAPRVLEASTLLLRDDAMAGQVMDLASPPWAPASGLALHLASRLRDPMLVCSPQEFLRAPRLPELSLAVWTTAREAATPAELGGFLVDDALSPPSAIPRPAQRKRLWTSW